MEGTTEHRHLTHIEVCLFCIVGTWERNHRTCWGMPSSNTLGSMSDVKISQAALLSNRVEQSFYESVSGQFLVFCAGGFLFHFVFSDRVALVYTLIHSGIRGG